MIGDNNNTEKIREGKEQRGRRKRSKTLETASYHVPCSMVSFAYRAHLFFTIN